LAELVIGDETRHPLRRLGGVADGDEGVSGDVVVLPRPRSPGTSLPEQLERPEMRCLGEITPSGLQGQLPVWFVNQPVRRGAVPGDRGAAVPCRLCSIVCSAVT
jgi:hypothetical protein